MLIKSIPPILNVRIEGADLYITAPGNEAEVEKLKLCIKEIGKIREYLDEQRIEYKEMKKRVNHRLVVDTIVIHLSH